MKLNALPIHFALERKAESIATTLISKGANVNAVDGHKDTPLHIAVQQGLDQLIKILLDHDADVSVQGGMQINTIHQATHPETAPEQPRSRVSFMSAMESFNTKQNSPRLDPLGSTMDAWLKQRMGWDSFCQSERYLYMIDRSETINALERFDGSD